MVAVIGAGLPRTGTTSMKVALERLGFGPCHHMFEIITHPEQAEGWATLATGRPADWGAILAGYNACHDWPSGFFWHELANAYPEAKVILTVRDPNEWINSFNVLMRNGVSAVASDDLHEDAPPLLRAMQQMRPLLNRMRRETFGIGGEDGEEVPDAVGVEAYRRHIENVQSSLPPERLLVFDVRDGWNRLCGFLGVDVPDQPFPHLNDSEFLKRATASAVEGGGFPNPFTAES